MLKNKTFFITGASAGLGKALAVQLANKDSNIAVMARNTTKLAETGSLCKNNPLLITGDICCESDCESAITQVINRFGRLDYLILNAGISMWSHFDKLPDLSTIHQIMQTNYIGAVNCTYYALPHLKKTNGMITVISSIQGKIGVPFHTGYAASKHALEGFFNSLRIELDKQVDILIVSPGWIKGTDLKKHALGQTENNARNTSSHNKQAVTLETCCNEIISAMIKRKRELVIPKKYQVISWLKLMVPYLLDKVIKQKIS